MVDFKITKIQKLKEVNNSMCHNYYYIVYGRIYNESKTKYKKFKFVEWFDIFDMLEYYEKDFVTKEEIKNYADNLTDSIGCSYLCDVKSNNDEKGLKDFYNYCNQTIEEYNKIL